MKRLIYLILTIIMAIVIFGFSSQESKKSNELSHKIDIKIFNLVKEKTEETSVSQNVSSKVDVERNDINSEEIKKDNAVKENKEQPKYPLDNKTFNDIDYIVRKTAHVTLYTLFAIFLTLFIKTYKIKNWKTILIVIVIGFLYACFDEYNQKIRGTRTGIFSDTLYDTSGCIIGLTITMILLKLKNNK